MTPKQPDWMYQREKELFDLSDNLLEAIYLLPSDDLLIEASGVNCFNSMATRLHDLLYNSYKRRYETFSLPTQPQMVKH